MVDRWNNSVQGGRRPAYTALQGGSLIYWRTRWGGGGGGKGGSGVGWSLAKWNKTNDTRCVFELFPITNQPSPATGSAGPADELLRDIASDEQKSEMGLSLKISLNEIRFSVFQLESDS